MRIGAPARRHGVRDEDMSHTGPATDGALREIGILDIDGADPVVIHAQPLRPKFHQFLE